MKHNDHSGQKKLEHQCHNHCRHKGVVSQCQVPGPSNTHKVSVRTLTGSEALDISSNNSYPFELS